MTKYFGKQILFILGLVILIYPHISMANPFNAVAACLTDPCGCGHGRFTRSWGLSSPSDAIKGNCPPWNTTADRGGCLNQFPIPVEFEINYLKFCAEDTGSSNFFDPKIKVRIQTCNVACWTLSDDIGDGQCKIYPGPFGIPTVRLCARPAFPKFTATTTIGSSVGNTFSAVGGSTGGTFTRESTYGYTYGWHLDNNGYPTADTIFRDDDNQEIILNMPKTCAYWDPYLGDVFGSVLGFFLNGIQQMVTGLDSTASSAGITQAHIDKFEREAGVTASESRARTMMRIAQAYFQPDTWDINPVYQPVHYAEGGTHFLFRMIVTMYRMSMSIAQMRDQLVAMAGSQMDLPEPMIQAISGLLHVVSFGGFPHGNPAIMNLLEYFGQINNVVSASLGCATVPLGPYPPPYCPTLTTPQPSPIVTKICPTEMVGTTATATIPTSLTRCVKSSIANNAVHNGVRVSFSDSLPICTRTMTPNSGLCVRIPLSQGASGAPTYVSSARAMDVLTSGSHTLPACSRIPAPASEMPCVESLSMNQKCTGGNRHCTRRLRLLYTDAQSSSSRQEYYSDIPDCTVSSSSTCQKIWGVDLGEYTDMSLNFPAVENGASTSPLTATANLVDPTNSTLALTAKIFRSTTQVAGQSMDKANIYVFDSSNALVGSVARAAQPMPDVTRCDVPAPSARATCTTSHVRPALVAKVEVGSSSTEGALSVDSYYPAPGSVATETLNLAGYSYTAFATDNTLVTSPFRGPRSYNASSIYGNYQGGAAPYHSDGSINAGAVYQSGLEYTSGQYIYGGTSLCLQGYEFEKCGIGSSPINCVKTRMTNTGLINCADFQRRIISNSSYNGITLCNSQQLSSYSLLRNESFTSPNLTVGIYRSPSGSQHCYNYSSSAANGELCATGLTRSLRVDPPASIAGTLSPGQYFNYNPSTTNVSVPYEVRDKTPMEHGLCVPIPPLPTCPATIGNDASWSTASMGTDSTGTCRAGYIPKNANALRRSCSRNTSGGAALANLTSSMGCESACYITSSGDYINKSYNPLFKAVVLDSGGHDSIGSGGNYTHDIRLRVPMDTRELKLRTVGVDDGVRVRVNGNDVGTVPASGVPGSDTRRRNVRDFNLDLLPYVRPDRILDIRFEVRVYDRGRFDAAIRYDAPGCPNFTFR